MDERLQEAATWGDIDSLYQLMQNNPNLLDQIDEKPFAATPLHLAAFAGQTPFAKEIMKLKPSFAKKLNEDGFSPMHLALQNGQTRLVLQFLQIDNDLVCIKGREGMTPLHCAAKAGEKDLLQSFLNACPKSIEDVTIRNETALHVALNSGTFQAFEVLVWWLKEGCCKKDHYRERKVLNWKDEEGNTVLHIAASKDIPQALKILLDCRVDVKSKNLRGFTALDMINGQAQCANAEIINMISRSGELAAPLFPPVDCFGHYLRLDQWLWSAAKNGDVDALYAIIQEDPYILEHIDQVPFDDTPLHIAASAGHTLFAVEIMRLKPSFARKLNRDGFSPMHLALHNNQLPTVRRLVDEDDNLVRVKGRKGLTPLHYATKQGIEQEYLELLAELLMACPRSIEDLTVRRESALHIAAKNDRWEALKLLANWLEHVGQTKVLDWPDNEGNTVLHIARQKNQIKAVKMLADAVDAPFVLGALFPRWFRTKVYLSAKTSSFAGFSGRADYLRRRISRFERWAIASYRKEFLMSNATQNAILVVAVLIATATYGVFVNPPSLYSDDNVSGGGTGSDAYANAPTSFAPKSSGLTFYYLPLFIAFLILNIIAFYISILKMINLLPNGLYFIGPLVMPFILCNATWLMDETDLILGTFLLGVVIISVVALSKWDIGTLIFRRRRRAVKQLLLKQRQELQKELQHGSYYGNATARN